MTNSLSRVAAIQMVSTPSIEENIATAKRLIADAVSYTHSRAHETVLELVGRLLLEKKRLL